MRAFITIPEFTAGERVSIFLQVRNMARERALEPVAALAERGVTHDLQTRELDSIWANRSRGRMYTQAAMKMGRRVQRVLMSIRDLPAAHTRGLPDSDPLHARVRDMLDDIYPAGVGAIVTLPFVDRVAAVEVVLDKLQTTHEPLVRELTMSRQVAHLAELTVAYRDAVDNGRTLRFKEVHEAHEQGQALLRALIALILGTFYDDRDTHHQAARAELLEPVEHVLQIARARRAQRRQPKSAADEPGTAADQTGDAPTQADSATDQAGQAPSQTGAARRQAGQAQATGRPFPGPGDEPGARLAGAGDRAPEMRLLRGARPGGRHE